LFCCRHFGNHLPCFVQAEGDRYPAYKAANRLEHYLRQDVLSMAKTIEQFQADIRTGKPDAEQAYENFKIHTKQHVAQLALVCSSFPMLPVSSE
jgi:hypothetical protein